MIVNLKAPGHLQTDLVTQYPFENPHRITDITIIGESLNNVDFNYIKNTMKILKNLDIEGTKTTIIPQSALYQHTNLTTVNLGCNIKSIGNNAFEGCGGLKTINGPEIDTIGILAFNETSLIEISFPKVVKLAVGAFAKCRVLSRVDLPSVEFIDDNTFQGNTSLRTINLPKIVKICGSFKGCSSLTSVNLGPDIKEICAMTFMTCNSLNTITCEAIKPPIINQVTFGLTIPYTNTVTILVPKVSEDAYKKNWTPQKIGTRAKPQNNISFRATMMSSEREKSSTERTTFKSYISKLIGFK